MSNTLSFSPPSSSSASTSTSTSSSYNNLNKNNPNFQLIKYIILHDLSLLCSFIISHPLYFSYFLFFSRYFIKLISFVSPLFITAVLLSLLLTTTTALSPKLPHLKLGILQTVIHELKLNLDEANGDEKDRPFEDFEVYKIVFDENTLSVTVCNEGGDESYETCCLMKKVLECSDLDELGFEKFEDNSVRDGWRNDDTVNGGCRNDGTINVHGCWRNDNMVTDSYVNETEKEKGLEQLLEELDRFEEFTTSTETETDSDEVTEESTKADADSDEVIEAAAIDSSGHDSQRQNSVRLSSWRSNSSREKEWRRTLACKLFEERNNSGLGEEGMDSLWEVYEIGNLKNQREIVISKTDRGTESFTDEEEEEEEMSSGHLCCLQALKISTRKMNLGMGKSNLVKISKAFKGFGWLHQVKSKHGKRRSN